MNIRKILSLVLAIALLTVSVPLFEQAAEAAGMPYRITVDLTNQIVTIYSNKSGEIVRQFLCSSGAKDATPTGTFKMPSKERDTERTPWFHFRAFGGYARYASRIHFDVMFHSLLYNRPNVRALDPQSVKDYGYAVSHGCIRLRWQDAEFIAKNCLPGTKVKIYKSHERDEDLRSLLFQSSFVADETHSYKSFLGIPEEEGVMGRYSEGEDVRNLQLRLRDLGIYTDSVNGVYALPTVAAVREAQGMMNMEQTGIATLDFQKAIYSGDAPFSMRVTLKEGTSSPAVKSLQESLTVLKIYDGPIDSVYDVDVMKSVKLFQSAYGYDIVDEASPVVQQAIFYEAGRIKTMFAGSSGYHMDKIDEQIYMGKVNCPLGIRLRKKPAADGSAITVLKQGNVVVAIERHNDWALVQKGSKRGYVMNRYLDFYPQTISSLRYTADDSELSHTIGYTAESYFSGADRPADVFEDYMKSGGSLTSYDGFKNYATVVLEDESLKLNLRESPDTSSNVLATLENGMQIEVLSDKEDWTMVEYNGQQGYLLSKYLELWTGPEGALDNSADDTEDEALLQELENEEDDEVEHAEVSCDTDSKAAVYEEDFADAKVLGNLSNGTKVEVIRTKDGWSHIRFQGREGYMREIDLKFLIGGYTT
ncbi:MAG: SH3 domain-containing protein [Clostridia bacterium]|nr:SH3 domain-containing protein [Clostridia bacterium]